MKKLFNLILLILIPLLSYSQIGGYNGVIKEVKDGAILDTIPVVVPGNVAITIADNAVSDTFIVININYDASTLSNLITALNPDYARYTSVEDLLPGGAQNLDSTQFVDVGSEKDVRGYKYATYWATVDTNNSDSVTIKILAKHTSAGSDEYPLSSDFVTISTPNDYLSAPANRYFLLTPDADQLVFIRVELNNSIAYLQFQVSCINQGTTPGQIDNLYLI